MINSFPLSCHLIQIDWFTFYFNVYILIDRRVGGGDCSQLKFLEKFTEGEILISSFKVKLP